MRIYERYPGQEIDRRPARIASIARQALSGSAATSNRALTEDWLSVAIGLLIFALALAGLAGKDLLGWAVTASIWTDATQALKTASNAYASLGAIGALIATYAALLVVLTAGAAALRADVRSFAVAFTAAYFIAYASWIVGNYAKLAAATPADLQKFGISWSLRLTNEGGFIVALIAGLVIANFFPRFADWLKEATPASRLQISRRALGFRKRRAGIA
jgi:hypothetical protein